MTSGARSPLEIPTRAQLPVRTITPLRFSATGRLVGGCPTHRWRPNGPRAADFSTRAMPGITLHRPKRVRPPTRRQGLDRKGMSCKTDRSGRWIAFRSNRNQLVTVNNGREGGVDS
jgi:hypothetical protein